jgi:hypothetical protein
VKQPTTTGAGNVESSVEATNTTTTTRPVRSCRVGKRLFFKSSREMLRRANLHIEQSFILFQIFNINLRFAGMFCGIKNKPNEN